MQVQIIVSYCVTVLSRASSPASVKWMDRLKTLSSNYGTLSWAVPTCTGTASPPTNHTLEASVETEQAFAVHPYCCLTKCRVLPSSGPRSSMIRDTVVAIKRRRLERRTAAVANSTLLEFRPAGISIVSGRAASVVAGEDSVHSNRTHGWNDKLLKWLRAHPE